MKIKFTIIITLLFLVTSFIGSYAQTGKVVGKVIDSETGEPLIGANVIISGTTLGAATNVDGDYIILNVPPNNYTIVAKYIGYNSVTQSNILVSVGYTTEADFSLPAETYELKTIEVIAIKPLINKNKTNSGSDIDQEQLRNLPIRGVANVVGTQAGVVSQGGNLYVRGGRADAVAFYVDGVLVNDPLFGGASTLGIQNAVQEIQFQAGGYPAEYGGANAGIITTTTKIGGEEYDFSIEGITDNFVKVGDKFLNSYSYGYSEYVFTAGGPILPDYKKLRFFIAGNNVFNRTPIAFNQGVNFQGLYDPTLVGTSSVDTFNLSYPEGYRMGYSKSQYQVQGNLSWDLNPFSIKVSGSYLFGETRNGVGYFNLNSISRTGLVEDETITGSLKLTHVVSDKAFYDVIVNYFNDFNVTMDPFLKHDVAAYGDSVRNAEFGTILGYRNRSVESGQLSGDGVGPRVMSLYGWTFSRAETPFNAYQKVRYETLGGQINLLYQIGQNHEMKTGVDLKYYTIRRYALPSPMSIASLLRAIPDGGTYDWYNRVDNYGYDAFGNVSNSGLEAPKHPVFAAYYIQDKMEFSDLVINAGIRLDYIDIAGKEFINPANVGFDGGDIDPSTLKDTEPFVQLSPRLGFSFPVTDVTIFHAQYGKFIQQSRLRDVYQGYKVIADNIKGGFAISAPVGFGLKPERTTQYEIGFKQQIGDFFAFDLTGFYKDIKDQIQIRPVPAEQGANHRQYYAFVNNDFSTVKGLEVKFDLRRTQRLSASLDYTYSDAQGTGSNPSSSFRQIWQSPTATPFFPQQIAPLDFNQAHLVFLNFDYRYADNDGPELFGAKFLQNFGLNVLLSAKSGFNYTRWDEESFGNRAFPLEALNTSTTPWTFQVDLKVDKSFKFGTFDANIYVFVANLLNTQNVVNVFNVSGDAYNDGWLTSPQGVQTVESIRTAYGDEKAQEYESLYSAFNYDPNNFGTPRQIRVGVRLNY